jgi:hypothetical protein
MNTRIKVRFNLGAGKNYQKWKVEGLAAGVLYLDPEEVSIVMTNCSFRNHKGVAKKIFEGANKTVCAWILCDEILFVQPDKLQETSQQAKYNPRTQPNWLLDGEIIDGQTRPRLHTVGRKIFIE